MHSLPMIGLLLICVLANSGCMHAGKQPLPPMSCPQPPPLPPSLMQPPETEKKVRAELLAPPPSVTPR